MRRISLALALIGAVAVTGCGAGKPPTGGTDSGTLKGTYGQSFYVNLFSTPIGGTITSGDGRINCGAQSVVVVNNAYVFTYYGSGATLSNKCGQFLYNWADVVTLTANPQGTNVFASWAGDCTGGSATCGLDTSKSGGDKTVVGVFGKAGYVGHTSFLDPALHGPAARTGALTCFNCHALTTASGIAPACNSCHGVGAVGKLPDLVHPADLTSTPALQNQHGALFAAGWDSVDKFPAACKGCHYADRQLQGASEVPGCNKCHGLPHDPTSFWGDYTYPVGAPHPAAYYADASASAGSKGCFDCHKGLNFMAAETKGLAPAAPLTATSCFTCHTTFNHNSYTHPAAYEGEFYSGGRTGYTDGFVGSFDGSVAGSNATYNIPGLAGWVGALPIYGSYKTGADTWEPNCVGCHGTTETRGAAPAVKPLEGFSNGAPSCAECHYAPPQPEVLGNALANHFTATKEAWALYSFSQACERCHTAGGFKDYVGVTAPANNLNKTFNIDALGQTGTQGMTGGGYAPGPLECSVCHNTVTDPSRDALHGIHVPGITSIGFPSLIQIDNVDKGRALCGTCHQARVATANIVNAIAGKPAAVANLGVTYASVSVNAAGSNSGGVIGMQYANLVAAAPAVAVAKPDVGYTGIFNGTPTPALNGVKCTVTAVTIGASNTTLSCALPGGSTVVAAPGRNVAVPCVVLTTATSNTTCKTDATLATNIAVPVASAQTGYAATSESAIFYPTATGGSAATLVDANRAWTAGQWIGWYVFFQTGANAGKYAAVTANTGTTLTFAALPAAVAAGDFYQIVTEVEADVAVKATAAAGALLTTNNPHYLGAVATEFGAEAAGFYQYPGKAYVGRAAHVNLKKTVLAANDAAAATCADCHDAHTLELKVDACTSCHGKNAEQIAVAPMLQNWTGGSEVGVEAQINGLKAKLYQAIQAYASVKGGAAICFDNNVNAYWFIGAAGDKTPAADGLCYDGGGNNVACCVNGGTQGWGAKVAAPVTVGTGSSPRLYRATYNYKFSVKENGGWAHNPVYVAQVLFDAIVDLNASGAIAPVTVGTRPY